MMFIYYIENLLLNVGIESEAFPEVKEPNKDKGGNCHHQKMRKNGDRQHWQLQAWATFGHCCTSNSMWERARALNGLKILGGIKYENAAKTKVLVTKFFGSNNVVDIY